MLAAMRATLLLVALAACGGAASPGGAAEPGGGSALVAAPTAAPAGPTAPPSLDAIEARLLGEQVIVIGFSIRSEGTVTSKVEGDLTVTADNRARWRFSGSVAGKPVSIDKTLGAGDGEHLTEAIVLGWTRMGLLHNIYLLAHGGAIEHAGGGFADFVATKPTASDATSVSVDLVVAGEPMGTAHLEVDSLALPRLRHQTVRFPEGEMKVVEQYSVSVPDVVPAGAF
jgi:hypothetical protein